jgi:hypothetical protein
MNNPFKQQMVRMKFPPDSGGVISIEGFLLQEEEDGCVELPQNLVKAAESHGLTVAGPRIAKPIQQNQGRR